MLWGKLSNTIIFNLKVNLIDMKVNLAKREVLSFLALIYDPLGLVNPFVFYWKLLFPKICISKVGWYERMSRHLLQEWW